MNQQMEKALEIIKKLQEENDKYFEEIHILKLYIRKLEESKLKESQTRIEESQSFSVDAILSEAGEAMKRNVAKIRKECEKYAKQKQSKG